MNRGLAIGVVLGMVGLGVVLGVGLAHQDDATPAVSAAAPGATLTTAPPAVTVDGKPAPPLVATTIDGASQVSLADYRGTTVVVNFWASWCKPCRKEAPELVAFAKAHPDVVMLSVEGSDDDLAAGKAFAAEAGWTWSIVRDDGSIASAWGVAGLPQTFVVDAAGRIVSRKFGETTATELASMTRQA